MHCFAQSPMMLFTVPEKHARKPLIDRPIACSWAISQPAATLMQRGDDACNVMWPNKVINVTVDWPVQ